MYVNITQTFTHKLMICNELHDFIIICAGCQRKVVQEREYFCPIFEISASEFTNDKWVTNYLAIT